MSFCFTSHWEHGQDICWRCHFCLWEQLSGTLQRVVAVCKQTVVCQEASERPSGLRAFNLTPPDSVGKCSCLLRAAPSPLARLSSLPPSFRLCLESFSPGCVVSTIVGREDRIVQRLGACPVCSPEAYLCYGQTPSGTQ